MSDDTRHGLEIVQALACAMASGIREVAEHPVALVPDGYRLADLEPFMKRPSRYTGTFRTREIGAMQSYLEAHLTEETRLFIDPDNMDARAIFDMGRPESPAWRAHTALLTLSLDPAFAALRDLAEQPVGVARMLDFLADWHPLLTFSAPGDDQTMSVNIAAQRLQKLEALAGGHDELEATHLRGLGERRALASSAPTGLTLTTPMYQGLSQVPVIARMSYAIDREPVIRLRIIGLDMLRMTKVEEFTERLTHINGLSRAQIFIGTFGD